MILGCHVQMKAPLFVEGSVLEALSYKANALMLYTGAPQNNQRKPVEELHIPEAHALMKKNNLPLERMIVHAPYLINLSNTLFPEKIQTGKEIFANELKRTKAIGATYLVLHPGASVSKDAKLGCKTLAENLNTMEIPEGIVVCLETMAGKGSEVGTNFEQFAEIFSSLKHPEHYAICLDTCHIHDGGLDVSKVDSILDDFDHVIGLDRLKVVHLNDSKNVQGSHKDRHANIGQGEIGFNSLYAWASNTRIQQIPKILETPYIEDQPPYAMEMDMLRNGTYDPKRFETFKEK